MHRTKRIIYNFTTLASVGLGGWCLGKYSEQKRDENQNQDNGTSILSTVRIRKMPGLPLYGTVSAATPLKTAENNLGMGSKLSSAATRVSQVINMIYERLL